VTAGDALWQMALVMLAGMSLGLMETAYGAHLRVLRFRRGWHDLTDLLAPLLGAAVVVTALALSNWGEIRLWAVVGLAMGYGLWRWLAAPFVWRMLVWANRTACRLCGWTWSPVHHGGRLAAKWGRALWRRLALRRP
jgi:hypothetical protein